MFIRIWLLITKSFGIWGKASASRMSAAMTYFTMLSLAPLLVIAIAIAGVFFADGLAQKEIVEQVVLLTNENIGKTVADLMANAVKPEKGLFAGIISIGVLLFGASGVFSQLQETFDEIWEVPVEKRQGFLLAIRNRLIGILMVFVAGILLLTTLGLSTGISALTNRVADHPQLKTWLELADRGVSFLLIPIILSLLFWLIPRTDISWQDVWPAAMLTAFGLSVARFLIELYLTYTTTSEVYGAAGSLVVLLIWIYMCGLVLFYGAAFSRAWCEIFGSRSEAANHNV